VATLSDDLSLAIDAFAKRDVDGARTPDKEGFTAAQTSAATHLDCLSEALTAPDAAAYHRLKAIGADLLDKPDEMAPSFRAAVEADKTYIFPMTIAGRGSTLRNGYTVAVGVPVAERVELVLPPEHSAVVDGKANDTRPDGLPTILQLLGADGAVTETVYVSPGADLPEWANYVEPVAEVEPEVIPEAPPLWEGDAVETAADGNDAIPIPEPRPPEDPEPELGPNVPILAAAGGSALLGMALYGVSSSAKGAFNDPNTPVDELDGLRSTSNTMGYAAQGALATAVGLATIGMVVEF